MKSDSKLRDDIIAELKWEPSVHEAEIGVAVKDGVVTLSGNVKSYAEKFAAERAVERVSGVRAIAEGLEVRIGLDHKRTDSDIAAAAAAALDWDVEVPDVVKAKIEDGWLTLEGTVEWQFQKAAAERAVRYLNGVRGVSNLLKIKPKHVSKFVVSEKIKDALRRNAEIDASHITVEAADGTVTLKGRVRSWVERSDAERAAWAAPGVRKVDDRIEVGM